MKRLLVLPALMAMLALAAPPVPAARTDPYQPTWIAVNPVTDSVYVATYSSMQVFNGITMESVGRIRLGRYVLGIAVNPTMNRIFAARRRSLDVIDGATNALVASVALGDNPQGVAVNTVTNRIYVTNRRRNVVHVVDGATNTLLTEIPVGTDPQGVAVNELTNRIYTANTGSLTVSVIDGATNAAIATVPASLYPQRIAVDQSTNRIYVACRDVIDVIDGATNSRVKSIITPFSGGFLGAAANSRTNRVYVSNYAGVVIVLDGETDELMEVLYAGNGAYGVAVNETANRVYVANLASFNISMFLGSELLGNSSFDGVNDDGSIRSWKPVNLGPEDGLDAGDLPDLPYLFEGKWSFRFAGAPGVTKSLEQRLQASGSAGTTLNLEGVSMAENASPTGSTFQLKARLRFVDGTSDAFAVNFPGGTHDWRRRVKTYLAPKAFDDILVSLTYSDPSPTSRVRFDVLHLWMGE